MFFSSMTENGNRILEGTILERALLCALTCANALDFQDLAEIPFSVERLQEGHLFSLVHPEQSDLKIVNGGLDGLQANVLFYPQGGLLEKHPIADIWFRISSSKELILIDCSGTGSSSNKVSKKKRQLKQLRASGQLDDWNVWAIVFAPLETTELTLHDRCAEFTLVTVGGCLARRWLGAWVQLLHYLPKDSEDEVAEQSMH